MNVVILPPQRGERTRDLSAWKGKHPAPKKDPAAIPMRDFTLLVLAGNPETDFTFEGLTWRRKRYEGLRGAESGRLRVVEHDRKSADPVSNLRWHTWLWLWDEALDLPAGKIVNGFCTIFWPRYGHVPPPLQWPFTLKLEPKQLLALSNRRQRNQEHERQKQSA